MGYCRFPLKKALYRYVTFFLAPVSGKLRNVTVYYIRISQSARLVDDIVFAIDFRFLYAPCFVKTYYCSLPSKTLLPSVIQTTDKSWTTSILNDGNKFTVLLA